MFSCFFCETVEWLVILWTFLCPDSCIISVGDTPLLTKFWVIEFLPKWRLKFGSSPAFCAIVFIKLLSLFTPTGAFLNQGLPEPHLHCFLPSKTVHRRFSSPRVAFLRRLCILSLYWTFLVVQHSKQFQCYWYINLGMYIIIWDYLSLRQKAKQYTEKPHLQSFKTQVKLSLILG